MEDEFRAIANAIHQERGCPPPPPRAGQGFTLIELSIVLVIIGLIAGGVLVGRDLIHAAKLRAAITEMEAFKTAAMTFHGKYNALPGDMPDATEFWGSRAACPTGWDPTTDPVPTCNGNGDGAIARNNHIANPASDAHEKMRFWQHLSNAGLLSRQYSGVGLNDDPNAPVLDVSVPSSRIGGGYYVEYFDPQSNDLFPGNYGNTLFLGSPTSGGMILPLLTNADAYAIDSKMDDGKPGTGMVRSTRPFFYTPDCTTSTDPAVSVYDFSKTGAACAMVFPNAF